MPTFYNLSQSSAAKQVFLTAGVGTVGCEDVARVSMSVCVCTHCCVFVQFGPTDGCVASHMRGILRFSKCMVVLGGRGLQTAVGVD